MKTYSKLLIDEPPLQVLPTLAKLIGLNEAIVTQQVQYWINHYRRSEGESQYRPHFHNGRWWVYNSIRQWREDNFPFWSEKTIYRTFDDARTLGIILTGQFSQDKRDKTLWYSIDYDKLDTLMNAGESPLGQLGVMSRTTWGNLPLTETTAETTKPIGDFVPEMAVPPTTFPSEKKTLKTQEKRLEEPVYTDDPFEESTAIRTRKLEGSTPDERRILALLGVMRWQNNSQKASWNRAARLFPIDWLLSMAEWASGKSKASPRRLFISAVDPNLKSGAVNSGAVSNFREWATVELRRLDSTGSSFDERSVQIRTCLERLTV